MPGMGRMGGMEQSGPMGAMGGMGGRGGWGGMEGMGGMLGKMLGTGDMGDMMGLVSSMLGNGDLGDMIEGGMETMLGGLEEMVGEIITSFAEELDFDEMGEKMMILVNDLVDEVFENIEVSVHFLGIQQKATSLQSSCHS